MEFEVVPFTRDKFHGERISADGISILVLPRRAGKKEESTIDPILLTGDGKAPGSDGASFSWWMPPIGFVGESNTERMDGVCAAVRTSWIDQFTFSEESQLQDGAVRPGLRQPQIGAIHSTIGHWKMSDAPATVVMPTGTGKTETMVALTIHERPERVFIIVPSDILRTQITDKFLTLGLLKQLGVCGPRALYPVVGLLKHQTKSTQELETFLRSCHVVVSTMSLVSRFTPSERAVCAAASTHLFVDEAHHIRAATWEQFRDDFRSRPILQFTATPFRNDGQHVDGRVVFNYPLRRAQAEKYFTPIRLLPVFEFDPDEVDKAIALAAIKQLTDDIAAGHDHILLARVASIPAAEQLIELYNLHGKSFNPRLVHSKLSSGVRRECIAELRSRQSRIAICVDMFGEGFDLPELKIAALHDTHKSLAVTLQFMGRFTRAKNTIGEATVVVNLADPAVDDSLRESYAEGSDWNQILRNLSEAATGQHSAVQQFVDDFTVQNLMIPIQNLTPAMSAVVYRTNCLDWKPYKLGECFPEDSVISGPAVNAAQLVAYIVTKDLFPIDWGEIREFVNTSYELSLIYWDKDRQLLFIHTSNKESSHETIAKAVAGDNAELIKGTTVFRVFSGLNRLLLQTLGLTHAVGRLIRFTMLVGADIHSGLAEGQTQTKVKTNIFASGFENGSFVTIGCSRKGRLWSRLSATNLLAWVDWCNDVGTKLLDPNFSEENILNNSIVPEEISERPKLVPLVIEWPTRFYELDDAYISVEFGGTKLPMYRVGMRLMTHDDTSPIRFNIFSDEDSAEFELRYSKTGADYAQMSGPEVAITVGRRKKSMSDWFKAEPPIVRFEQDAFTEDNQLCRLNQVRSEIFDKHKIEAWTWQGVDLSRESQTDHKYADSIQYRVIEHLKSSSAPVQYEILFDDDSAGEAADVIGLAVSNDELIIHFFHCKYSIDPYPGARTADLFVLCGQAQLSVQWRSNIANLLSHLMHRDIARVKQGRPTRFERGDRRQLLKIQRQAPTLTPKCAVFMVQPGLSKTSVSVRQLELLGATELYLMETSQMPLRVVASE